MTGQQWSTVITLAMFAHGAEPTVDQVCFIAERCYPDNWGPTQRELERMIAPYQIRQGLQLAAYRRATAIELGEADVEATEMFGEPEVRLGA